MIQFRGCLKLRAALVLLATITIAAPGAAQSLLLEPFGRSSVSLDIFRPMFEGDDDVDALSFAAFVTFRVPLRSGTFIADLPFSRVGTDIEDGSGIGNIMVGYESAERTSFHVLLRIPTGSASISNFLGFLADVQRFEAFSGDLTSFKFGVTHRGNRATTPAFDIGMDLVGLLPDEGGDFEAALDYGAQIVARPRAFGVTGGLAGRLIITADNADFAERTLHELRLLFDYTSNGLRPFAGVTLPLDEGTRDEVPWVLRLGLILAFN